MAKSLTNDQLDELRQGNGSFGSAIEALKQGYKVARSGWNNSNIWLELQVPDENSKMTLPYIYMVKNKNKFPCNLSCESTLAEDWTTVE